MPVQQSDIQFYLSGGMDNTEPNDSLGGDRSSALISNDTFENLFDNVEADEAAAGTIEYRAFYVVNEHATDTLRQVKVWVSTATASPETSLALGQSAAGLSVVDEATQPSGVSFQQATTSGTAIDLGDLGPGAEALIWVERTVDAGAATLPLDNATITLRGVA